MNLFSRKLEHPKYVTAMVFNYYFNPHPSQRNGRRLWRVPRRGPKLVRWDKPHIRSYDKEYLSDYQSESEEYWEEKKEWLSFRGKPPAKKGQGKKSRKRAAKESREAAASS